MKTFCVFTYLFLITLFFSCQNDLEIMDSSGQLAKTTNSQTCVNKGVKIVILSDIHVMDPSLLVRDGSAFQTYLARDPKLLQYSTEILQVAIVKIISLRPDLVLIPGDLTKDGEKISHETVSRMLKQLTMNGIKVVVTVGNHDVNNPEALRYIKDKTVSVPNVQADRIPTIYANYGFNNAISRDANSLSYVNEPVNGLWVISIDANKYYLNTTTNVWGGVIKPKTMTWIKEQLAKAKSEGKTVIGMMHQGLIEHYLLQNMVDPGYVVDNYESTADELMDAGMKIIFTGHYHATDITKREHNGKFIFDVETGSTVNYPCTFRILSIMGNEYSFKPQSATALMGRRFDTYAKTFLSEHLDGYFQYVLMNLYNVPAEYALGFAPYFKAAAMAHFAGDETMPSEVLQQFSELNTLDPTKTLSNVLGSLWTDINTPDNNLTINMETGAVQ
ncbi:MAG: metallophosphoesterase [Paludibacter sp.]